MNLEEIAKKSLGQQEELLESLGRQQYIAYETNESIQLAKENPERFMRVGSKTNITTKGTK